MLSHRMGPLGLVLVLVLVIFGPAIAFPLIWDDKALILHNPFLNDPSNLLRIASADFWELTATPHTSGMYRPLVTLSYFLERILLGDSPMVPHSSNLLIHLLNTALLGWLTHRVGGTSLSTAVCAALFALHPAMVEPVANVAGRTDPMAALWLLVALHLRFNRPALGAQIASGVAVLLGLLCKEQAIVAVPLVLLFDARFETNEKHQLQWWLKRATAPIGATLIYLGLRFWALGAILPTTTVLAHDTTQWQFWDGAYRTLLYTWHMVFPISVTPYHVLPPADALTGSAAILGLLLGLFYLWRFPRVNARFAVAWFVIALAPMAHWLPVQVRFSDLFLYVPMVGVALGAASAVKDHRRTALVLLGLAGLWGTYSAYNVHNWSSERALFQHAVKHYPQSASAHLGLAHALHQDGEEWKSFGHFEAAIELATEQNDTLTAAKSSFALGNIVFGPGHLDAAKRHFERAVKVTNGGFYQATVGLARVELQRQNAKAAHQYAKQALERAPNDPDVTNLMGIVTARQGDLSGAKHWFERTLALQPNHTQAQNNLNMLRGALK